MCCISCSSSRKLLMISTIYKAPSALPFRYAAVWIRLYIRVWDVREQSRFLENIVWFSSQPSHCRRWFNSNPLRLSILDCYFQNSWNSRIWTFLNNFIMRLRLWIWTIYLVGLDVLCHRILLLTGSFMSIWTVLIEIPSFRRSWVVAVGGQWQTLLHPLLDVHVTVYSHSKILSWPPSILFDGGNKGGLWQWAVCRIFVLVGWLISGPRWTFVCSCTNR